MSLSPTLGSALKKKRENERKKQAIKLNSKGTTWTPVYIKSMRKVTQKSHIMPVKLRALFAPSGT